ncbi:SapC family protein [Fluviibacterium sp. DFM31]|uniref:SapC family protein n=1 Tax=Meridianimarinicoccus marinus TaxID=3231483 RepID=A0ABV3L3L4_9RHOB
MATQLLIYERATPITVSRHKDHSVKTGEDYSFAAKINAVPLMATEFSTAAQEFAVVFAGTEGRVMPTAVCGARAEENLYVSDDGKWQAPYLPAFIRQYPFVFASSNDGETLTLCLDEEFTGVNTDGRGERLFDSDGERTTYLKGMVEFSRSYQQHFRRTEQFCARLLEYDLLEPMQAQFRGPAGDIVQLTGFQAVNRDRLKALEADVLKGLCAADELELIYIHLQSMRNFERLVARLDGAVPEGQARAESETPVLEDAEVE